MKLQLIAAITSALVVLSPGVFAKTLQVEVHGMTCAFCVSSLKRKLKAMPDINEVDISLKIGQVRVQTNGDEPDVEAIKQTVIDAGFTPIAVEEISNAAQ